ncbi:MADS-box transcription factor 31-like [Nicotiana sylvestris]|uniref:MADS-box transcription factor 31-like n=1 Tax=Nicotiana sylvestris TaxID=4096 RepID=A0A1U7UVK3_NICSY|nr:PREDICTED: MADS-box transcription factor 31-like [Nicotiana sylvestris]
MVNEHRRSVVLQERMETLFKKAEELSVLCDVEIGIIVFSPDERNAEYEWPSRDKFKQLMMRYLDKPLLERLKKLTTNEMFLRKEMDAKMKKIDQQKTEEKEMEQIFSQLYLGEKTIFDLDKRQLIGVRNLAIKAKEKAVKRRIQLKYLQDQRLSLPFDRILIRVAPLNVQDQRLQLSVDDPLALRLAPLNVHDQRLQLPVDDPLALRLAPPEN